MGVAVYAGLVGALLLCVILVLCVGVLAYRRRCRHLHGDITDSSSALTAAFHPGNYKPPRQGKFTTTISHTSVSHIIMCLLFLFVFTEVLLHNSFCYHAAIYIIPLISFLQVIISLLIVNSLFLTALHFFFFFYILSICHGTPLVLAIKY